MANGIPRGIEVLLKKASVDPAFKELLLARRHEAAQSIELALTPIEKVILQSAPADMLTSMIDKTKVPQEHRRVFLGHAATAMLAALGIVALQPACGPKGSRPDSAPQQSSKPQPPSTPSEKDPFGNGDIAGSRPDIPDR